MSSFKKSSLTKITFDPSSIDPNFPMIIDDVTLAQYLSITTKTLWFLLQQRNNMEAYKCFSIPRYSKNEPTKRLSNREIQEPQGFMKEVHRRLNYLFRIIPLDDSVAAYRKGKNCADAAKRHLRKSFYVPIDPNKSIEEQQHTDPRYQTRRVPKDPQDTSSEKILQHQQPLCMIKLDISNFFPSIKASWIRSYFSEAVGYSNYVASLLATLCSVKRIIDVPGSDPFEVRHLPQGSPLSGALANLVAYHRFGKEILTYLKQHSPDWVVTIYSDDIIMTHPSQTITDTEINMVTNSVKEIIGHAGFVINDMKTLIRRSHKGKVKILGCVVTDKLNIPRTLRKDIEFKLHMCSKFGFESSKPKDKSIGYYLQYLQGILEHIRSIRPDLAVKYTAMLDAAKELHSKELADNIVGGEMQ